MNGTYERSSELPGRTRKQTKKFWNELDRGDYNMLGSHVTQCGLCRGLPPYQVASWSTQPFGHNRHGLKIGGCALFGVGVGAGFPSNRMWLGPRRTSTPSFILIHPTVWPQYTNVTDRQERTDWRSQLEWGGGTDGRSCTLAKPAAHCPEKEPEEL